MKKIILSLLLCTVSLQINAAHSNWIEDCCKTYLKRELNSYDADGSTILIRTISTVPQTAADLIHQFQKIKFLIALGADVNLGTLPTQKNHFTISTPIHKAVTPTMPIEQQHHIIELLLQEGADPLREERVTRANAIELSLLRLMYRPGITNLLIRHVVQKNIQEERGFSQSFTKFLGATRPHEWPQLIKDLAEKTTTLKQLSYDNMLKKTEKFCDKLDMA